MAFGKRLDGSSERSAADTELSRIQSEIDRLNAELWRAGRDISTQRRKIIPKLKRPS
jgi:hypothetical protein